VRYVGIFRWPLPSVPFKPANRPQLSAQQPKFNRPRVLTNRPNLVRPLATANQPAVHFPPSGSLLKISSGQQTWPLALTLQAGSHNKSANRPKSHLPRQPAVCSNSHGLLVIPPSSLDISIFRWPMPALLHPLTNRPFNQNPSCSSIGRLLKFPRLAHSGQPP
jgi:hypothetical protein